MEDFESNDHKKISLDNIRDRLGEISEFINFLCFSSVLGFFGILANVVNIAVFYMQGFCSITNIALFTMAISDLCCLINSEWLCIAANTAIAKYEIPWVVFVLICLTGCWPYLCFFRATSPITIYVTSFRNESSILLMKIKSIITPKRTTIGLLAISCMNSVALVPEYVSSYLECVFTTERNQTLLTIAFIGQRKYLKGLENALGMVSFFGVIMFTIILVVKVQNASNQRREAAVSSEQSRILSTKEQKTVKMVTLIAIILILCYTPCVALSIATSVIGPEFNVLGKHYDIFLYALSLSHLLHIVNSSVNTIPYHNMSSKYRQTFRKLFMKWERLD